MNWSNFFTGAFFAVCVCIGLWLTMPASDVQWRQCAPEQAGEVLQSTVQYEDKTECFYADRVKTKKVPKRKVTA